MNGSHKSVTHFEDYDLALGALQGRSDAVDRFLRRMTCVARILRALNRRVKGHLTDDEMVDLVQDALLVIWKKLREFEGRSSLETWVYRICRLELLNAVRRKRRDVEAIDDGDASLSDGAWDLGDGPWNEGSVGSMDAAAACAALEEIGHPNADIIRMKHFEHLTFSEIGDRLGLSPNTIKSHYYRGLSRLRESLGLGRGEAA